MERRSLGSSGLEISRIGLGTWAIGGHMWGGQDDAASIDAIHACIDHGVNWIDTAPIYGSGHSEEVVGRALKQLPASRRPMVFTKFGLGIDSDTPTRSASPARSRRRMRRQPASARRRTDRSVSAALARAAADCRDCRRLRRPARRRGRFAPSACRTSPWPNSKNGARPACRCTPISHRSASSGPP